jgi:hypothetical protein
MLGSAWKDRLKSSIIPSVFKYLVSFNFDYCRKEIAG